MNWKPKNYNARKFDYNWNKKCKLERKLEKRIRHNYKLRNIIMKYEIQKPNGCLDIDKLIDLEYELLWDIYSFWKYPIMSNVTRKYRERVYVKGEIDNKKLLELEDELKNDLCEITNFFEI